MPSAFLNSIRPRSIDFHSAPVLKVHRGLCVKAEILITSDPDARLFQNITINLIIDDLEMSHRSLFVRRQLKEQRS